MLQHPRTGELQFNYIFVLGFKVYTIIQNKKLPFDSHNLTVKSELMFTYNFKVPYYCMYSGTSKCDVAVL